MKKGQQKSNGGRKTEVATSKTTTAASEHDKDLHSLGLRLKEIREKQKISQSELARRCGIDQGAISRTESGQSGPSWETLNAIAKGLGIPLHSLFTDEFEVAVFVAGVEAQLMNFLEIQRKSIAVAENLLAEISTLKRAKSNAQPPKQEPVVTSWIRKPEL